MAREEEFVIAVAHALAHLIYEVLASGQPCHHRRGPALDPRQKERIIRHHDQRLGKLGVAVYRPLVAPNNPYKTAASKSVPQ